MKVNSHFLLRRCWCSSHQQLIPFPNPTHGSFTINVNGTVRPTDEYAVRLYNTLGQIIYEAKIERNVISHLVPLDATPAGLYFLVVRKNSQPFDTRKIVVH